MAIDPRIPTMPERSTSGFRQPGRHCLHHVRSAVRCSTSRMKGKLRILPGTVRKTSGLRGGGATAPPPLLPSDKLSTRMHHRIVAIADTTSAGAAAAPQAGLGCILPPQRMYPLPAWRSTVAVLGALPRHPWPLLPVGDRPDMPSFLMQA